jgi:hypothetical protein
MFGLTALAAVGLTLMAAITTGLGSPDWYWWLGAAVVVDAIFGRMLYLDNRPTINNID